MIVKELFAKFGLLVDQKSIDKADGAMNSIKGKLGQVASLAAVAFGAKVFAGMVGQTIEAAARINDLSQRLGMGAEGFQKLAFAAKQSGVEQESFAQAMTLLNVKAGEAAMGNKDAQESFSRLGISLKDANGKAKGTDVLFANIADAIKKTEDPMKRVAVARDLLGRGGATLVPLLKGGSEEVALLTKRFTALGGVMDKDMIKQADDADDRFNEIKATFQGVKNTITKALLPSIIKISKAFTDWVEKNGTLIRMEIGGFFVKLAGAAEFAADRIGTFLRTMDDAFGLMNILKAGVIGLGIAFLILNASMLLPVALFGVILLLLEEIAANFSDTEGLFEKFSGRWDEITKKLRDPDINDSPIISVLKQAVSLATELFSWIDKAFSLVFKVSAKLAQAPGDEEGDVFRKAALIQQAKDARASPATIQAIAGASPNVVSNTVINVDASGQAIDEDQLVQKLRIMTQQEEGRRNRIMQEGLTPSSARGTRGGF